MHVADVITADVIDLVCHFSAGREAKLPLSRAAQQRAATNRSSESMASMSRIGS
jgi:hypothetical protein